MGLGSGARLRLEADRPEEADREPEPLPDRLEELELPFLAVELVGFFCAELAMVSSFRSIAPVRTVRGRKST